MGIADEFGFPTDEATAMERAMNTPQQVAELVIVSFVAGIVGR